MFLIFSSSTLDSSNKPIISFIKQSQNNTRVSSNSLPTSPSLMPLLCAHTIGAVIRYKTVRSESNQDLKSWPHRRSPGRLPFPDAGFVHPSEAHISNDLTCVPIDNEQQVHPSANNGFCVVNNGRGPVCPKTVIVMSAKMCNAATNTAKQAEGQTHFAICQGWEAKGEAAASREQSWQMDGVSRYDCAPSPHADCAWLPAKEMSLPPL